MIVTVGWGIGVMKRVLLTLMVFAQPVDAQEYVKQPYYAEIEITQLKSPSERKKTVSIVQKRWSDGQGHLRIEQSYMPN